MSTITLFDAAGKVGTRITHALKDALPICCRP